MNEKLYVEVETVVQQSEEAVRRAMSFNGSVLVGTGIYQSTRDVRELYTSLNATANRLGITSANAVYYINRNATAVRAAKTRAERARSIIQTAVNTSRQAQGNIDFIFDAKPVFDSNSETCSATLTLLTAQRDQIRANLTEDLACLRNANSTGVNASNVAQTALATAQLRRNSSEMELKDSELLIRDAETAFQAACGTSNGTNTAKVRTDVEKTDA